MLPDGRWWLKTASAGASCLMSCCINKGTENGRAMNIQEIVDRRIEELRAQALAEMDGIVANDPPDVHAGQSAVRQPPGHSAAAPAAPPPPLGDDAGEFVDRALSRLATRILDISEQLADDYATLEKEMLKARLAALQSVETVLDIVLSIRREARDLSGREADMRLRERMMELHRPGAAGYSTTSITSDPEDYDAGRASMHDNGVAALFQRTQ